MSDPIEPARRRACLGLVASSLLWGGGWGCGGKVGEPEPTPPRGDAPPPEPPTATPDAGQRRVGTAAPAWDVPFVAGDGPTLASLRGRVILLRFWTDTCPFCQATAPALVAIDEAYRDRGVSVIGMYHPKPRGTSRSAEAVAEVAANYGFRFPIGLDLDWAVLDAYWLSLPGRRYTSVSFIIDKMGVVRFVHPGPEFHPGGPADHQSCRDDYAAVTAALDTWLA